MKKVTFIAFTDRGIEKALLLQREYPKSLIITSHASESEQVSIVDSVQEYVTENFTKRDAFCFLGALGICVRMIAPSLDSKQKEGSLAVSAPRSHLRTILASNCRIWRLCSTLVLVWSKHDLDLATGGSTGPTSG